VSVENLRISIINHKKLQSSYHNILKSYTQPTNTTDDLMGKQQEAHEKCEWKAEESE